jgi:hypothetical protein
LKFQLGVAKAWAGPAFEVPTFGGPGVGGSSFEGLALAGPALEVPTFGGPSLKCSLTTIAIAIAMLLRWVTVPLEPGLRRVAKC